MALITGQFPTFKGLNYNWGTTASGATAWRDWLYDQYNWARINGHFEYMKTLGCHVIRVWVFLDGMIDKTDPNWGTSSWSPTYVAARKANWEDFLTNIVLRNNMKVLPTLYITTSSNIATDTAYLLDTYVNTSAASCALEPTVDGATLVGGATLNGDLALDPFTNGFTKNPGGASATWQNVSAGSPPLGATKEIALVGGASTWVNTAIATLDTADPLCLWEFDVKGNNIKVDIIYLNSSNVEVGSVIAVATANYADWTTLKFGSVDLMDLDMVGAGATRFRLRFTVSSGTSYMSGHRCRYAGHSAKWQNYVDLTEDFCKTLYGAGTAFADAIAGWDLSNEPYESVRAYRIHPLLAGMYDAIKGTSALPIIAGSATVVPYETLAHQGWYTDCCDIIGFHRYNTAGTLPSLTNLERPWILEECGAALAGNAYKSTTLNPPALQGLFNAAWAASTRALCVMPFDFLTNESISTPAIPNRLAPFSDAAAGTTIKNWTAGVASGDITLSVEVAWSGQLTGVFTIGTSTIDGTDVIAGDFGNNVFDDITADVKTLECSRGRANDMSTVQQGRAVLRLTDNTGKYNPENSGSSLDGYLVPMRPIRIRETYNGTTYGLFYGYIAAIRHDPSPNAKESVIEAVDFFEWLSLAKVTISTLTNKTVDYIIGQILDTVGWTDPAMRSLAASQDVVPSFSADGSTAALTLIEDLLSTERGMFFMDGNGVATFLNRNTQYATGSPDTIFGQASLGSLQTSVEKDRIINGQTVTRVGGTAQTATDATSRKNYGYRDGNAIRSSYIGSDSQANSLASWIVSMNKDPRSPAREVLLRATDSETLIQMLTREIGDLVTITETPGGTSFDGRIQSIAHKIAQGTHETRFIINKVTISAFQIGFSTIDGTDVIGY